MDFTKINTVNIHDGKYSVDDIFSIAMIKLLNKDVKIERNSENKKLLDAIYTYDNILDTKQDNAISVLAFGKDKLTFSIWNKVSRDLMNKYGIVHVDEGVEYLYSTYIKKIVFCDRSDEKFNEYLEIKNFFEILNHNLNNEESKNNSPDENYLLALDVATILLENWIRMTKEEVDFRLIENEIWDKAAANSQDGIYVLDQYIPWRNQLKRNPDSNVKIVIYEGQRGGYIVLSRSTDQVKIKKSSYLNFVHPHEFMGVAKSLEDAILAAKNCL